MKIINTKIKGLIVVKQNSFKDKRGSLRITHNENILKKNNFVFEYCTTSKKNSLRGFHFQHKFLQAKYVSVIKGKILDCVIDLRKKSKTFGKIYKIILSQKNCLSLYIPQGFAHAYFSLDEINIIYYKLSNFYKPQYEDGIFPLDAGLNIKWPSKKIRISKKDKMHGSYADFIKKHKYL